MTCAWQEVPFQEKAGPSVLFLAVPTYSGWVKASGVMGIMLANPEGRQHIEFGQGSVLTLNFNRTWAKALNTRARGGWTHYGMHHADITAPEGWADVLIREMRRVGADLISAVVPIKDGRRLSSHGAVQKDGSVRRLTMKEVHRLPETFTSDDLPSVGVEGPLVVNTGLFICDFTAPWVEEVHFHTLNGLERQSDGNWKAAMMPEDWLFSHTLNERGLRIAGTRAIRVGHWGEVEFTNESAPDGCETDPGD